MIVGNKIDLEEKRVVSKQRGLEYAESKKIAFYEVSAKDGTNINLIFTRIAEGSIRGSLELEKAVTQNNTASKNENIDPVREPKKVSVVGEKKEEEVIVLNKETEEKRKQDSKGKKKCCGE